MEQKRRNTTRTKKRHSTSPVVHIFKVLGTLLLSIFLIVIITMSIFGTVLTIYIFNFADTTTTVTLEKNPQSNISRFLYDNPDYDEETDDPKDQYELYYSMRNKYKHYIWVDLENIPQVVFFLCFVHCVEPESKAQNLRKRPLLSGLLE